MATRNGLVYMGVEWDGIGPPSKTICFIFDESGSGGLQRSHLAKAVENGGQGVRYRADPASIICELAVAYASGRFTVGLPSRFLPQEIDSVTFYTPAYSGSPHPLLPQSWHKLTCTRATPPVVKLRNTTYYNHQNELRKELYNCPVRTDVHTEVPLSITPNICTNAPITPPPRVGVRTVGSSGWGSLGHGEGSWGT
jgi:hypothetical protein